MPLINHIDAVIIDLDGCLNSTAIGLPIDLRPLVEIQKLSLAALEDPMIPEIILNTGRALNYAEAFVQMIGSKRHFIFELGIAIAKLEGARTIIIRDPRISESDIDRMMGLERDFLSSFPQYRQFLQIGKKFMSTFVFEINAPEIAKCAQDLKKYMETHQFAFLLDVGHNFINILYPNVDKETGLRLLKSHENGLEFEHLAGIGDSNSDWPFLKLCHYKACPSNASEWLKTKCDYVSQRSEAFAVLDILRIIIDNNRSLKRQK